MLRRRGSGGEGGFDTLRVGELEGTVDLVGRDVVEEFPLVAFGAGFPADLCGLEKGKCAHHVGAGESEGVEDRAVHMAFGREMDHAVDLIFLHDAAHLVVVADVGPDEGIVGFVLDVLQVGEVAGVGELVEVDDVVVGIFVDEETDHVRTDESGASGDENVHDFRIVSLII